MVLGCAPHPCGTQTSGYACHLSRGLEPLILSLGWNGPDFPPTPPAGAPLSQVGWAELWFLAPILRRCLPGFWFELPPQEERNGYRVPPSRGFTRSGSTAVGGGGERCGEARDNSGDSSRAIVTPLIRVNSSLMCTQILPIPNVFSPLALVLFAPPSVSFELFVPLSTCPSRLLPVI